MSIQATNDVKRDVPAWLETLGIKRGEFFTDSKLRAKRAMTSKAFCPAARMYAYLSLHTMAFQQERAVKMVQGGKRVPVTPADVCAATGIRREHFRKHMAELEAAGLAECKGTTKGRVEIRCWAVPRPSDDRIVTKAVTMNPGCPPELAALLKRYRVLGRPGVSLHQETIAKLQQLAQVTFVAETSLRAYADCLANGSAPNKDEMNETYVERNGSSSSSVSEGDTEPGMTTTTRSEAPSVRLQTEAESVVPILDAFDVKRCSIDAPRARQLLRDCRMLSPDVAVAELAAIIEEQEIGPTLKNARGFLLTAARNACDPESLDRFRRKHTSNVLEAARKLEREKAQRLETARAVLGDPEATDQEREWARTELAEAGVSANQEHPCRGVEPGS